jgi:chromosomal replication initiation ATPase DnaA
MLIQSPKAFAGATRIRTAHASSPSACAVSIVAQAYGIEKALFYHRSRCGAETALARQLAMYLAHVILQESMPAIGAAFGRDRTTVSHACALIEDRRDDPAFDAMVADLELALEAEGQANG